MARGEAEDAGGLTPAKDNNDAARYVILSAELCFNFVDYIYPPLENHKEGKGDCKREMGGV